MQDGAHLVLGHLPGLLERWGHHDFGEYLMEGLVLGWGRCPCLDFIANGILFFLQLLDVDLDLLQFLGARLKLILIFGFEVNQVLFQLLTSLLCLAQFS